MSDIDYSKRYWLFACRYYYAQGGLNDIVKTSDEQLTIVNFYDAFENETENEWSKDRSDFSWKIYDSKNNTYKGYVE